MIKYLIASTFAGAAFGAAAGVLIHGHQHNADHDPGEEKSSALRGLAIGAATGLGAAASCEIRRAA